MDIYHKSSPDFNNTYSVAWAVLSYAPTDKRSTHISHLSHWPRIKMELPKYTGDDGIRESTVRAKRPYLKVRMAAQALLGLGPPVFSCFRFPSLARSLHQAGPPS